MEPKEPQKKYEVCTPDGTAACHTDVLEYALAVADVLLGRVYIWSSILGKYVSTRP